MVPKIVCEALVKKKSIGKFFNRKIYKHMYIVASILASCYPEVPTVPIESPSNTYDVSGTCMYYDRNWVEGLPWHLIVP